MATGPILLLDDDEADAAAIRSTLAQAGFAVVACPGRGAAAAARRRQEPALAIVGLPARPEAVAAFLADARSDLPGLGLVALAERGSIAAATAAIAAGALDVLYRPVQPSALLALLHAACHPAGEPLHAHPGRGPDEAFAGRSAAAQGLLREIAFAAAERHPLLITGPPGAGKSLVAWLVHAHAPARNAPFLACDQRTVAGGIPGAPAPAALLPLAAGGTLVVDGAQFLDQAALAELTAPGRTARLVLCADAAPDGWVDPAWAATLRVGQTIPVPPLRARGEDVEAIAAHSLQRLAALHGRRLTLAAAALHRLHGHHWPGNVRELVDVLAAAARRAVDGTILPVHLALGRERCPGDEARCLGDLAARTLATASDGAYRSWLDRMDAIILGTAIAQHGGNQLRTARSLGINRATLRKRLHELRLAGGGAAGAGAGRPPA